jgi:hypothetical protein
MFQPNCKPFCTDYWYVALGFLSCALFLLPLDHSRLACSRFLFKHVACYFTYSGGHTVHTCQPLKVRRQTPCWTTPSGLRAVVETEYGTWTLSSSGGQLVHWFAGQVLAWRPSDWNILSSFIMQGVTLGLWVNILLLRQSPSGLSRHLIQAAKNVCHFATTFAPWYQALFFDRLYSFVNMYSRLTG